MKIKIKLPFTLGAHVVAKINLNTWKVGDVISVARDKSSYLLLFNDGTKARIEAKFVHSFPTKGKVGVYSTEEVKRVLRK